MLLVSLVLFCAYQEGRKEKSFINKARVLICLGESVVQVQLHDLPSELQSSVCMQTITSQMFKNISNFMQDN